MLRMFSWGSRRTGVVLAMALVINLLAGGSLSVQAADRRGSSAAEFYKGKVVRLIVPYSPGGGFDQYPRFAQPAIEKNLPGAAVVVENFPGAGGILGSNRIYRAKPDGLTIGSGNIGGMAFAAATEQQGVQFDLGKFTWLGRMYSEAWYEGKVVVTSSKGRINSVDDLRNLGRPVLISSTGAGSDDYYLATILFKALAIPAKLVTGYGGQQESNLAVLRGEVDCTFGTMGGVRTSLEGGDMKIVIALSNAPIKGYENAPLAKDMAMSKEGQQLLSAAFNALELERSFIGPPGIPADRVAYLRTALKKAYADPEVLSRLSRAKRPVAWLDGNICEEKIKTVVASSQILKDTLKAALKAAEMGK